MKGNRRKMQNRKRKEGRTTPEKKMTAAWKERKIYNIFQLTEQQII